MQHSNYYIPIITTGVFAIFYLSGIVGSWRTFRRYGLKSRMANLVTSLAWPFTLTIFWVGYLLGEGFTALTTFVRRISFTFTDEEKEKRINKNIEVFEKIRQELAADIEKRLVTVQDGKFTEILQRLERIERSTKPFTKNSNTSKTDNDELLEEAVQEVEGSKAEELMEDTPNIK